ncbi:PadR family transcriptional regulator [Deinococcus maricopensis]|uniref:Transcriptional regulator PadR family protein n=1 Tax=Deinococcus maricopensis (strain DSM 21211 / LMG 22137 / NRRL B-23946 / LB-34) TaxID=709986 RepID=E8U4I7_DEIML|nr:PadR family transcriptional regulator [Deinococcus maricopensis]ADV68852.1 transcriptional regulator PadR family protein [Deinococcus maricopensis DSM 21211]
MSDATLGPSAYIVLGLLAQYGPATSYDLKRWVDDSIGYFWSFPRSQLYAEPQRLSALGLLSDAQEQDGRRKRTYTITDAGRRALSAWLAAPAGPVELRDPGLLKLFFIGVAPGGQRALAAEQLALHRARLAEYEALAANLCTDVTQQPLGMGLLYERASLAFWSTLLDGAPQDQ